MMVGSHLMVFELTGIDAGTWWLYATQGPKTPAVSYTRQFEHSYAGEITLTNTPLELYEYRVKHHSQYQAGGLRRFDFLPLHLRPFS